MDTLLATPDTDVLAPTDLEHHGLEHRDLGCRDLVTTFLAASRALDDDLPQFWD